MFRKIQRTAYILAYKHQPLHPDLPSEEPPSRLSKVSAQLGALIQLVIIGSAVGALGSWLARLLFPHQPQILSVETLGGIAGGLCVVLVQWVRQAIENQIHATIGHPVAPYVGHKLEETFKTLKGDTVRAQINESSR